MTHDYTPQDIVHALRSVGSDSSDIVFVHSNLGYFGRMQGARDATTLASEFLRAFETVLGPRGTLVVPTFTYSYCRHQTFDPLTTPSVCGTFSEFVRQAPGTVRSLDANFSVAARGARADELTRDAPTHSFGPGSFWERLLKSGGRICNLNFDAGSTFLHYVEREMGVHYRYDKRFEGTSLLDGRLVEGVFEHYVYDLDKPEDEASFENFHRSAIARGIARVARLGRGEVLSLTARDAFDLLARELSQDQTFLRKGRRSS